MLVTACANRSALNPHPPSPRVEDIPRISTESHLNAAGSARKGASKATDAKIVGAPTGTTSSVRKTKGSVPRGYK
jgi:hypothetical protein